LYSVNAFISHSVNSMMGFSCRSVNDKRLTISLTNILVESLENSLGKLYQLDCIKQNDRLIKMNSELTTHLFEVFSERIEDNLGKSIETFVSALSCHLNHSMQISASANALYNFFKIQYEIIESVNSILKKENELICSESTSEVLKFCSKLPNNQDLSSYVTNNNLTGNFFWKFTYDHPDPEDEAWDELPFENKLQKLNFVNIFSKKNLEEDLEKEFQKRLDSIKLSLHAIYDYINSIY